MDHKLSKEARSELLEALRNRYKGAPKEAKSLILDQVMDLVGCHRRHAIRLLSGQGQVASAAIVVRRRLYDEAVREALIVLWEAADRICSKRLKAILPSLLEAMERHGHLALDAALRKRLLAASAATIDRLLAPVRGQACGRKKRKTPNRSGKQIPIRTFADWHGPLLVFWRSILWHTGAVQWREISSGAW